MIITDFNLAAYFDMKKVPIKSMRQWRYKGNTIQEIDFDIDEEGAKRLEETFCGTEIFKYIKSRSDLSKRAREIKVCGRNFPKEIRQEIKDSRANKPIGSKP